MSDFWLGYSAAIATYFVIGICLGFYLVITNLARFHGAGFQWGRMAFHIGLVTVFWPAAVGEMIEERR